MELSFHKEWVAPYYLGVLRGNYARGEWSHEEQLEFIAGVRQRIQLVTPDIVRQLLAEYWREAIVGSWLAGLAGLTECAEEIGELFLASKTCFAGQAHAFALACFANEESAQYLVRYLDTYLRKMDCDYDQKWAMPALLWVDEKLGTSHATAFLVKDGLWDSFIGRGETERTTLEQCKSHFGRCMLFCEEEIL